MSHSVVELVLASAVATDGTFTVGYPAGKSKGDFINGSDHRMVALQADHRVGKGFTIAFGDTAATVTWKGTTTIPASSRVWVQLDESGRDYRDEHLINKAVSATPMLISLGSPDTADPNGAVETQACTAAGGLATGFNGVYGTDGSDRAIFDVPRAPVAAWTTEAVLTLTCKDEYGNLVVMSSGSGTALTGTKAVKEIISVSSSVDITGLTVGTSDVLGLPFFLRDPNMITAEFQNDSLISGGGQKVFLPWQYNATQINAGTPWYLVCPVYGNITGIRSAVEIAFTTGGDITVEVTGTPVDGLSMAVDTGAAGTLDSDTPTLGHATTAVAPGVSIEVIGSAGFDSAGALNGVLEITQSGGQLGVYVAGSQAVGTATSGDVRGTLDPLTACDGVTSFAIVALVDDPNYLGAPQYAG
ncbi:hypothetical protein T8K17_11235 [Thalassobaculum sp. OXR-137]|uniref:hypothetical protein n=1 Tax=Thalassobaculum sp. OXR-137 TaxID=3100173 RepID=UPI002AC941D4|nr:hypothetical protein [Thalassobaculum sp. OXR-137]WPZ36708.1 hypothetical protein T8K17_11235 [Thalassobaculum sp. OXR-137]